jgi:uncharacterized protein YeaO (DUF488 family)
MLLGVKRVYDRREITDGKRILVDGLWPRGVKKSTQNVDLWMKEIAPSSGLRKWFSHDSDKWDEFKLRYREELAGNRKAYSELLEMARSGDVTLIYASKDAEHNNALVLLEFLKEKLQA